MAAALDVAALKATVQGEAALQAAVSVHEVGGGVEVAATAATARARGCGCSRRQAAASRRRRSRRLRALEAAAARDGRRRHRGGGARDDRARAPELAGLEAMVHEAAARPGVRYAGPVAFW